MINRQRSETVLYVADKLQNEMLHQELENEDELLLALAGLKQVCVCACVCVSVCVRECVCAYVRVRE